MKIAGTFTAALALAFDLALGASFSNPLKEFNGSDPFIVYSFWTHSMNALKSKIPARVC